MFNENKRCLNLNYHISVCSNFQTVVKNYLEKFGILKSIHRYVEACCPDPCERWSLQWEVDYVCS